MIYNGTPAEWCEQNQNSFVDELKALVAVPSISADPAYHGDVRRCARLFVERMNAIGLSATVLETSGNPVAYGEWLGAAGQPTIIIYGHYDVQPADPHDLWLTPPFEAQVRDGKIYGRGVVDDKGQVLMHLAAIEAHMKTRGGLPLNVKLVVEGEEEIGSPNFDEFLEKEKDRLQCDLAVISDTAVFAEGVPSLTTSLRGLVNWEIEVHGPSSDLHSGQYGGIVRNPIEALAVMLAQIK
ncbi:MAG: M20/M25/M40 family metallo-hydrolase, partial [Candidatus Eremiobacteraeota bacterium]|nr:M20/M25/M40 family metallo-hydrolase [Candidatus Eremiobacteraeota bacterium]